MLKNISQEDLELSDKKKKSNKESFLSELKQAFIEVNDTKKGKRKRNKSLDSLIAEI